MTDPLVNIEEKWKNAELLIDPVFSAQHDIQNLLKLVKAYEKQICLDHTEINYTPEKTYLIIIEPIKKEIFGVK